jgi:serine/threonine protein kinase
MRRRKIHRFRLEPTTALGNLGRAALRFALRYLQSCPYSASPQFFMSTSNDLHQAATVRGFAVGHTAFNRFTLEKILGRGGMGVVWLAKDEDLEQKVALKFLPEVIMSDRSALDDLKRETRRSREMTHPHIVRIYDFMRDDMTAAISMEFVSGDTLSNRRADQPQNVFSIQQLSPWVEQLCSGLHYAHTKAQVVHRDLKPANLMLDAAGEIKITDFGIARSISDSVSRVSAVCNSGTPVYMSPQQMMGEKPCVADDIYAFGATLYELLTSRPPFHSGNVILQVREKMPSTMAARRAELEIAGEPIPPEWEHIIAACLAKEPAGRPESMLKISEALGLSGGIPRTTQYNISDLPTVRAVSLPPAIPAPPAVPTLSTVPAPRAVPAPSAVAAPPKPRKPFPRWIVSVGTAAAVIILAAVFVPGWWNRHQAAGANGRAQELRSKGDWPAALATAAAAASRDASYANAYDKMQADWLSSLQPTDDPREFFAMLTSLPLEITGSLSAEHAARYKEIRSNGEEAYRKKLTTVTMDAETLALRGKFDEADALLSPWRPYSVLSPNDLTASETRVKAARIRRELLMAEESAAGGDTGSALARLNDLEAQNLLPDEVARGRAKVQAIATPVVVEQLATAIAADDAARVQAALNEYGRLSGKPASVTATALLAERDFEKFLRLLEQLGVRSADGAPRTNFLDLIVVEALRARFSSPESVSEFLAESYAASAEKMRHERPGAALLLAQHAQAIKVTALGSAVERGISEWLKTKLDLSLAFPPTETASDLSGTIQDAGRDELFEKLRPSIEAVMTPVKAPTSINPRTIVARTRMSALERKDDASPAAKKVLPMTNTVQIPNPERAKLEAELKSYETARLAGIGVGGASALLAALGKKTEKDVGIGGAVVGAGVGIYSQVNIDNVKKKLESTPATVSERKTIEIPYEEISHRLSYSASLVAELSSGGRSYGPPLRAAFSLTHEAVEKTGDPAQGAPIQPLVEPTDDELAMALRESVNKQFETSGPAMIKAIADASLDVVETQVTAAQTPQLATELRELRWVLVQLWQKAGVRVSDTNDTERTLRLALGLPVK